MARGKEIIQRTGALPWTLNWKYIIKLPFSHSPYPFWHGKFPQSKKKQSLRFWIYQIKGLLDKKLLSLNRIIHQIFFELFAGFFFTYEFTEFKYISNICQYLLTLKCTHSLPPQSLFGDSRLQKCRPQWAWFTYVDDHGINYGCKKLKVTWMSMKRRN